MSITSMMMRDAGNTKASGWGGYGGDGERPRGPKRSVSTKLYVSNLPETIKRHELMTLFEQHGEVVECDIVKNYAFVHYGTATEAKAASEHLHNYDMEGVNISVELSHSRVRQKPGMGDKNECFRCGHDGHWSRDCPKRGPVGRERGRDRYPPPSRRDPYPRSTDPYADEYYRDRYLPPPPVERYRPYADPYRRPPPPRDYYAREYADPYARPPPDYYRSRSPPSPRYSRDPYYERDYPPRRYPAAEAEAASPPARRPPPAAY